MVNINGKVFVVVILLLALSLTLNVDVVLAANETSSVSISQLGTAASSVNNFIKTNKRLPSYVTISGKQVNMPQFLYLLTSGTAQISAGSTAPINIKNVNPPIKPVEDLRKGNIPKTNYVKVAKSLKKYVDTYGRLPNYQTTSQGRIRFESDVQMFSKIMAFYKTNKRFPSYVYMAPWTGKSYTYTSPSSSYVKLTTTQMQINELSSTLKTYIENSNQIPTTVSIAGQKITISQFLQLLAHKILNDYSGSNTELTTQNINMATAPAENITSGNIGKTEYVSILQNLNNFTSTNNRLPNYFSTSLGKMRYESVLYLLLKINDFYLTNNRLPSYAYITPWTGTTVSEMGQGIKRPVYIISDMISNTATDNSRINAIVTALENMGLKAYNYGVGTDNIGILTTTTVPINGLIVEICGGACAGTIYEMGTSWYKSLKATRKVFMLFTDGATRITGLDWLNRAHDDNFSPATFTGLANPDQYLINNGYKYYEGYSSSKLSELVQILYQEATS